MRVINQTISRPLRLALAAAPFLLVIVIYSIASEIRLAENPNDKLLPSFEAMGERMWSYATEPDRRTGQVRLWADSLASLQILGLGMAISTALATVLGVFIGLVPHARAMLSSFVSTISLIPPITILPILFIIFPLGDDSKVALIVVGTAPIMVRSVALAVSELPRELIVKAQTLGASSWTLMMRVVLPQIWPKLILAMRLGLVPAWIFLISAEAIAAQEGLGHRIFLARRNFAMDVILPYVAWITLIAFLIDRALRALSRIFFRWAHLDNEGL